MTITFIDPAGPLGNTSEPIDFTASGTVIAVSVEYASGAWEVIWQDSKFARNYANSTIVGASWSIKRIGRWPEDFRVVVDEGSSSAWDTLKTFDFTVLPTQTASTTAEIVNITLDGYVFSLRNENISPNAQQINGTGFRFQTNARTWLSGATQIGPYLAIDPSQLPGYSAGRARCVLARVLAPCVNTSTNVVVGFFQPSGAALGISANTIVAASQTTASYLFKTSTTAQPLFFCTRGAEPAITTYSTDIVASSGIISTTVLGAIRKSDSEGRGIWGPWAGSFPTVEDMKALSGTDNTGHTGGGLLCGVGLGANGGIGSATITHLQILQARS